MTNKALNLAYSYIQKYSNRYNNLVEIYFQNLKQLENID